MVGGGVTDPIAQQALAYTFGMTQVGQWFALPPDTPEPIVAAYRQAYRATFRDAEFRERLSQVDAELTEMTAEDELALISKISATPPEVFTYMRSIARKQGVKMEE
jgi:tripartite-type tricarboxylate transporter receptor subunit TctC